MEPLNISFAIVDDHTLFRNGVVSLLHEFPDLKCCFQAAGGDEMQNQLLSSSPPDVILMDINMPQMDGCLCTSWLRKNYPNVLVLALSMYEDDNAVLKMIKAGARGYVLKQCTPKELYTAMITVHEKGYFLNELVSGKLIRSVAGSDDEITLSDREKQFLKLCCSELTYKEIADLMIVSPRTVDNYREALFQKLNLKTRVGLVLYAIQSRIHVLEHF